MWKNNTWWLLFRVHWVFPLINTSYWTKKIDGKSRKPVAWNASLQQMVHYMPCHAYFNSIHSLYSMTQFFRSNTIVWEKKYRKELKSEQDGIRFLFSSKTRDHNNIQTHERWQVWIGQQQGQTEKGHVSPRHLHVRLVCLSIHHMGYGIKYYRLVTLYWVKYICEYYLWYFEIIYLKVNI